MAFLTRLEESDLVRSLGISAERHPGITQDVIESYAPVTTTRQDMTAFGNVLLPDTAAALTCSSSSPLDTLLGTGARALLLNGLNAAFQRITEVVLLNGVLPATTVQQFLRVNSCLVIQSGSLQHNAGIINVRHGNNVMARIRPTEAVARQAVYTTPASFRSYILNYVFNNPAQRIVTFNGMLKPFGTNTWLNIIRIAVQQETAVFKPELPGFIPEKSDFKIQVNTDNGAVEWAYFLALNALERV